MDENKEYAILMNVANSIEADLIISKLGANGILATKAYQSSGAYLHIATGFNYQGTDIYVPSLQLDEALEIINEDQSSYFEDLTNHENKEFLSLGNRISCKRKSKVRLFIIIVLIIPILLSLLFNLTKFLL